MSRRLKAVLQKSWRWTELWKKWSSLAGRLAEDERVQFICREVVPLLIWGLGRKASKPDFDWLGKKNLLKVYWNSSQKKKNKPQKTKLRTLVIGIQLVYGTEMSDTLLASCFMDLSFVRNMTAWYNQGLHFIVSSVWDQLYIFFLFSFFPV